MSFFLLLLLHVCGDSGHGGMNPVLREQRCRLRSAVPNARGQGSARLGEKSSGLSVGLGKGQASEYGQAKRKREAAQFFTYQARLLRHHSIKRQMCFRPPKL